MVVYAFFVFDRHGKFSQVHEKGAHSLTYHAAECIYTRRWKDVVAASPTKARSASTSGRAGTTLSRQPGHSDDDAKLVFGTVYSLRNMVRKLGGEDDRSVQSQSICCQRPNFCTVFSATVPHNTSFTTTKLLPVSSLSCSPTSRQCLCGMPCSKYT